MSGVTVKETLEALKPSIDAFMASAEINKQQPGWHRHPYCAGDWLMIPGENAMTLAKSFGDKVSEMMSRGVVEHLSAKDVGTHDYSGIKACYGPIPKRPF